MRLDDSRVLVGIMLAIIISSTTLSVLVENQNDEKFSNPTPDEQNLHLTSQKSNATLSLTDIDSPRTMFNHIISTEINQYWKMSI